MDQSALKSRIDGELNYAALDFETAAGPGSICSVGIVAVSGNVTRAFETLVNPETPFDPRCVAVHGIRPEKVRLAPKLREALHEMLPYLESGLVIAHHAMFDMSQLSAALRGTGVRYPAMDVLCTLVLARRAFPGRPTYRLSALEELIGFPHRAHDALEDARAAASLFERCIRLPGDESVEAALRALCVREGRFEANQYQAACRAEKMSRAKKKLLREGARQLRWF